MKKIERDQIGSSILQSALNRSLEESRQLQQQQLNQKLPLVDIGNQTKQSLLNIDNVSSGLNLANSLIGAFGNSQQTAQNSTDTVFKSVGSTLSGAMAGLQVGGPIGAAVGALAGSIGKKGSVTANGFGQDPTMELGTGLIGGFTNRKIRRQARQMENAAENNRFGMLNASNALQNFYADYDTQVNTMQYGGTIPSDLAYVDDGETINTPDGNILEVPEKHQPVDSNLIELPEGSKILSNTLKVPGTKKTYAQMYKNMSSKRISKGKDIFAENSNKLNKLNDQILHDKLFSLQEIQKKGKKEFKGGLQEFQKGGIKTYHYNGIDYNIGDVFERNGKTYEVVPNSLFTYPPTVKEISVNHDTTGEPLTIYMPNEDNKQTTASTKKSKSNIQSKPKKLSGRQLANNLGLTGTSHITIDPITIDPIYNPTQQITPEEVISAVGNQYFTSTPSYTGDVVPITQTTHIYNPSSRSNILPYIRNIGDSLLELAPTFSNLLDRPESFSAQLNPYRDQINRTMANRSYDINPALRQIQRNRVITNYNANQLSPNTGASMAFRLQNAVNTNRAISDLYSQKNNIDSQYAADYANTLNNLGQQYIQAQNLAIDQNARSRAASRNINRTGLSQLSQWVQRNRLMRNQANSDQAMLELFGPYMQAGYTTEQWNKYLNKRS